MYPHEWLNHDSRAEVPIVTIDEYVRNNGIKRLDVVKIDTEGAELDGLIGMEETLRELRPKLIVCELTLMPEVGNPLRQSADVTRRAPAATDSRQIAGFVEQRGYELWRIIADGRLKPYHISEMTSDCLQMVNVAFVRPELKAQKPELFAGS